MKIDASRLIDALAAFPDTLAALVADVRGDEWRWKPTPNDWATIEVLGHLLREEREDFRIRLRMTLERPGAGRSADWCWPPIDPEGDVVKHSDIDADPGSVLEAFRDERTSSVAWLRSLVDSERPDWDAGYTHPEFGLFRAGDLLAAWADHDALHARQIIKRRHQMIENWGGGYECRYAGEW